MSKRVIDALAREPHFIEHLRPIWRALPERRRGTFYTSADMGPMARSVGLPAHDIPGKRIPPSDRPVLVASWGDHHKALLSGRVHVAETQHGIGQTYIDALGHPSYPGGNGRLPDSLLMVPNETAAGHWRRAYPDATVAVVGSPRLDALPEYEPSDPPIIAFSFHWAAKVSPEARSAFDDYAGSIAALAQRHPVIATAHPRMLPVVRRFYKRRSIEIVERLDDVIRRAALFIADNTSAIYEFAAAGRPVVVLNKPPKINARGKVGDVGYRRDMHHGLRFWDAAEVGVNVWDPDDLADAVEVALADPPERQQAREEALDIVYAYRSGGAQRAAGAIVDWLDGLCTMAA